MLATGIAAGLPVIVSVVRALAADWVPLGDDGVIASRSFDVLSIHTPLVGQFSTASIAGVGTVYSPGPLLYWLLAVPARFIGADAIAVTLGALNVACVMGSVALARKQGERALMFVVAAALAVMCRSLPAEIYHSAFNAGAGLLPFTLLVFLVWSLADGAYGLLPVIMLVGSFVAQVHLTYAPALLAVLIVALVSLGYRRRRARRAQPAEALSDWRRLRRSALAALGVGLICWSAPLVDELTNRPGNLVKLVRTLTASRPRLGLSDGWHVVVRALGIPPWWLRSPRTPSTTLHEMAVSPGPMAIVSCLTVLSGLIAAVLAGHRRPQLRTAALVSLLLTMALLATAASTPTDLRVQSTYTLWWGVPVGMWAWLVVGGSLLAWWPARWRKLLRIPSRPQRRTATWSAALAGVMACGILATTGQAGDVNQWGYSPARSLIGRVAPLLRDRRVVVSGPSTLTGFALVPGITYGLHRQGIRVLEEPDWVNDFGGYYDVGHRHYDDLLLIAEGDPAAPSGGHVLASVPLRRTPPLVEPQLASNRRRVTLVLIPGPSIRPWR